MDESESIVRGKREIDTIKDLVKYCTIESIKKTPLIDAILSDSPILGNKAKLQKQASIARQKDESDSKENDLYVEMSPLVPVENVKVVHNNLSETVSSNIMNIEFIRMLRGQPLCQIFACNRQSRIPIIMKKN